MHDSYRLTAAILGVSFALVQMQTAQALTKVEVSKIAQSVTVMIQSAQNPQASGSGIIIKRDGETYTVLTAYHVVQQSPAYQVMAPDRKLYPMVQGSIQPLPGVDLALMQFKSAGAYGVAKMGDSAQSPSGSASFVAGFPGTTAVRSEPEYYFTSGEIAANGSRPNKDGYALAYSNPTLPGMSGGPVLNEKGELIGIHGRAERAERLQNSQFRDDIAVLKTEFNYAIPINTFLSLAPKVNNTLALKTPSPSVSTAPKADDFFLQAEEKLSKTDFKGAIADFDRVLQLNPIYGTAYTGRGIARSNSGDKNGAIQDLSQAIRINPDNVRAYAVRGLTKFELGDKEGADADFRKTLSLNIDAQDYRAHNNRGLVRLKLGDRRGAIADYDQAIRINPNFFPSYINRGRVRSDLGDNRGAIADYDQAISLNSKHPMAYFFRAGTRRKLGDNRGAIADYDQAISLNPKIATYYTLRGKVRRELGDNKGAIADVDQAISLDPNSALAYSIRAVSYYTLGNKSEAIANFAKTAALYKTEGNQKSYQYYLEVVRHLSNGGSL
jgi:tetratricopeptide (TPR) repeat protein